MKLMHLGAGLALLLSAPAARAQEGGDTGKAAARFFTEKIRPVLEARCYECHSAKAEKLKGGLHLDSAKGLHAGGKSGAVLVPGHPELSRIIALLAGTNPDAVMPPKGDRLTDDQVEDFRAWIKMGAPDTRGPAGKWASGDDQWAFRPVRKVEPPDPDVHPVDAFIRRKLRERGLNPAAEADRVTLIRRATFDLTGLPPTPEEVRAFVEDRSPGAWKRVVDRLLASTGYGEQAGRLWLDVVRYADTAGFSNDWERPHAWRYRDYVIRSMNHDKPFDRFILEQVAGDELEPDNPEMLIAVGMLRMGPFELTAMSVPALRRQMFLDDVTHNTALAFLGLTLRCARCHDHKFDPIPTRDYYRWQAVFAPVQFADRGVPFLKDENTGDLDTIRDRLTRMLGSKGYTGVDPNPDRYVTRSLGKVGKKRTEHLKRSLKTVEALGFSVYNGPVKNYNSNSMTHPMPKPKEREGEIQEIHILPGGALASPADRVDPGVLSRVAGPKTEVPTTPGGRRLALAKWIAHPDNALTARVIVNRIWQQHFGNRGIVPTPGNFGKMGRRPTHPDLLDWLASTFVKEGWSLKKLHRLIMTSETYRRGPEPADRAATTRKDPSNELLGHYPSRRLAAEEMRDAMLSMTGELSPVAGGPGVYPEINWEVALQPRHVMGGPAPVYQPSPLPSERNRRTIYAFRRRTVADPMLEVLNRPGSEFSCARRDETTVTPQAFALFNGTFANDRALALAKRLTDECPDLDSRIDRAFELAYGRRPCDAERDACRAHVRRMTEHHRATEPVRTELPTKVRREMVEEFNGSVVQWDEDLMLMKEYTRDLKPWDVGPETRALAELCLVILNSNEFVYVR